MRSISKKIFSVFAASTLLMIAATAPVSADNYYKWVDEQGITHYGERPPKNTTSSKGKTQTGHSEPSTYTSVKKEVEKVAEKETPKQDLKDPERCAAAKNNLETIRTSARIKVKGDDGQFRYLNQAEIQERKQKAQKAVQESC